MKDFEEIILSTSNFYSQFSHQSFVNDTNENKINLSIFYTRFINRVCKNKFSKLDIQIY